MKSNHKKNNLNQIKRNENKNNENSHKKYKHNESRNNEYNHINNHRVLIITMNCNFNLKDK